MERSDKLYGIGTLLNNPDDIIKAAEKVSVAGYQDFDVHTPYPIHGMDDAMKLKPSKLGLVTLFFGLSGAAFALLFMTWIMTSVYPMVIGGKPYFPLPAFIPVTFEVTVLLATVMTVLFMIALFFKFPSNKHPLQDTNYMKNVSRDKFGIFIEASDPKFSEAAVKELYMELDGEGLEYVYEPVIENTPMWSPKFFGLLFGVAIVVSLGTYVLLNKIMFLPPFDWMMNQERLDPQETTQIFESGFGMLTPVEGTVARDSDPYGINTVETPDSNSINPLVVSEELTALGKDKYLVFCSPCHGNFGEGDSRLRDQFPAPPSLHSSKVRGWDDGNLYHVIVNGQNVMPSYRTQLEEHEIWAVITYVRALQRAMNASESDIRKVKEESSANE